MDVRLALTDCDKAGDYVVSNVLSPRDLVSRPDKMDETVLHTKSLILTHLAYIVNVKKCVILNNKVTICLYSGR